MKRKCWILPLLCILLLTIIPPFDVYGAQPIKVGFIDTGISTRHLEEAQVEAGKNYVFSDRDTLDREGHGTATAGMVLGSETLGIKGSCPGAVAVPLVTVDKYASGVFSKGDVSVMARAVYDAIDVYGCRVINMSMGVTEDAEELRRAVEYAEEKGVLVISAVGNDNVLYPRRSYYPACYPTVIGVGAAENLTVGSRTSVDRSEGGWKVADFSQRKGVSVLADGFQLATVTNRNAAETSLRSGTSYACAYVAGLCAQLLMDAPSLSPAEVRGILYAGARELGVPGKDAESGWGVVGLGIPSTEKVTRAMLVAFLHESAGTPEASNGVTAFTDVPADSYYAQAVTWAAKSGIVRGYSPSRFGPDDEVSREQMAVIMGNYARYQGLATEEGGTLTRFTDEGAVSDWARESMAWAVGRGLIQGKGNGILDPSGSTTRTEVAAIMQRFLIRLIQLDEKQYL